MTQQPTSPIKSGRLGNINGVIQHTDSSHIEVSEITLRLDKKTAWALCNLLHDIQLKKATGMLESDQHKAMSNLGAALGRLIDHSSANNGDREIIK